MRRSYSAGGRNHEIHETHENDSAGLQRLSRFFWPNKWFVTPMPPGGHGGVLEPRMARIRKGVRRIRDTLARLKYRYVRRLVLPRCEGRWFSCLSCVSW